MEIEVLIPCVNYADFLALTLPITKLLFDSITVITSPEDIQTQTAVQRNGVRAYLTDVWFKRGASFNKAAALNEYLAILKSTKRDCWILFLDADILFNRHLNSTLASLDKQGLYSVRRRMCESAEEWRGFLAGAIPWNDFLLNVPPVVEGKVWRHRPTSNPAALSGYFQLWHLRGSQGMDTLPDCPTAANYDVEFALSFPEEMRRYLDNHEVLHLGPSKINWNGRVSVSWKEAPHPIADDLLTRRY